DILFALTDLSDCKLRVRKLYPCVIASFGQASTQKSQKILCRAKAAQRLQSRGRPAASGLSRPVWTPLGRSRDLSMTASTSITASCEPVSAQLYQLSGYWAFGV